ncbi:MAG: hypothetical protein ABWK04_03345 [Hydrogenobacter sp.]
MFEIIMTLILGAIVIISLGIMLYEEMKPLPYEKDKKPQTNKPS